jgi:hypothetical protein
LFEVCHKVAKPQSFCLILLLEELLSMNAVLKKHSQWFDYLNAMHLSHSESQGLRKEASACEIHFEDHFFTE